MNNLDNAMSMWSQFMPFGGTNSPQPSAAQAPPQLQPPQTGNSWNGATPWFSPQSGGGQGSITPINQGSSGGGSNLAGAAGSLAGGSGGIGALLGSI